MIFNIIIVTVLLLIAIVLIILEVFFLPGITIAGIASVLFYVGSIYFAFAQLGVTAGIISIIAAVLLTWIMITYFMRSRTLDKIALKTNINDTAPNSIDTSISVGDEGVTLSRLNPMGQVVIGEKCVEARSTGDFINESTKVRVIKVEHTTIVVEPIENN